MEAGGKITCKEKGTSVKKWYKEIDKEKGNKNEERIEWRDPITNNMKTQDQKKFKIYSAFIV